MNTLFHFRLFVIINIAIINSAAKITLFFNTATLISSFIYNNPLFSQLLDLRSELKAYVLEVLLCQSQGVACVGEEYVAAMLIYCHVGMLAALEVA